jgi:chromate reductase
VIGASTGMFGAVWSQADLRNILARAGARVVEAELAVPNCHATFDETGDLADDALRSRLAEVVDALLEELVPVSVAA